MSDDAAKSAIKVDYYLELVVRRRWLLIVPFCLAMLSGIYVGITAPRIYSTKTLILVEPQSIPGRFVQPLTSTPVQQRVSTISQKVKSRTYLEQVIKDAKLYDGPAYKNMLPEEKVSAVRRKIKVKVKTSRKGPSSFTITYSGKDPKKVADAVNALATFFIDESVKLTEDQVIGASNFLAQQLKDKAKQLVDVETKLQRYRMKYMGGLPNQLATNLSMLSGLQKQLASKQESVREQKRLLLSIDEQMASLQEEIESYDPGVVTEEMGKTESGDSVALKQLKKEYMNLMTKYTERHPDVVKLKKKIKNLQSKIAEDAKTVVPSSHQPEKPKTKAELLAARYKAMKEGQLQKTQKKYKDLQHDIELQEEKIRALTERIADYEQRVEDTPRREQELVSLKRDYNNIGKSYNQLLSRKLDADIAVNMERNSKGERFRILDSAQVPKKPVSPDVKKLLLFSIVAGLGIGGGLIFVLDLLDTTLRRPEDIESLLEIPVLATIPNVYYSPKDRMKQLIDQGMTLVF
ncbi:MAG: hypothetical protein B6245_18115, partial [Desulfobacteraceae bacterium 4572_88]